MTQIIQWSAGALATTGDLRAQWLLYEGQRGLSPATLVTYDRGLTGFLNWVAETGRMGQSIRPSDVLEYRAYVAKSFSPASVNLKLSAVRSFFRWLVLTDRIEASPAALVEGVRRPDSHTHKRDALTASEVRAILDQCDDTQEGRRDRAILTLMLYCALRTVEIVRANIENLRTQRDRMVLEVWGKGRQEPDQIVVIPRDQEQAIRAWVSTRMKIAPHGDRDPLFVSLSNYTLARRITARGVRFVVKGILTEAGVAGGRKTTHSLRHTAITTAIEQGANPVQVQSMARHDSFDTTRRYYHEAARITNPAEDLIDYG